MKNKLLNIIIIIFIVIIAASIVVTVYLLRSSRITDQESEQVNREELSNIPDDIQTDHAVVPSETNEVDIPGVSDIPEDPTDNYEENREENSTEDIKDWAQEIADNMQQGGESTGWLVEESPSLWADYWDGVIEVLDSEIPDDYTDFMKIPAAVFYHSDIKFPEESFNAWKSYIGLKKHLGITDDSIVHGCYIAEQEHYWMLPSYGFYITTDKYETFLDGDMVYIKYH